MTDPLALIRLVRNSEDLWIGVVRLADRLQIRGHSMGLPIHRIQNIAEMAYQEFQHRSPVLLGYGLQPATADDLREISCSTD
jgi:hypothetical protein